MMKRFKYKIISSEYLNEERLNRFGRDGWELAGITSVGVYKKYHFKREL